MLNRLGQHLSVGVAANGVAVAHVRAWRAGRPELLAERQVAPSAQADAIAGALCEALAASSAQGFDVSIVLADELARMWQVTPPPGCTRVSDLQGAAALRFQTLYGVSPSGWKIAADWDATKSFLAVAAPAPLLAALEQVVREHHGCVVRVQPQFVAALNQWRNRRRAGAWFGVLQSQVLTLALFDGSSLAAVRPVPVLEQAGRAWLEEVIAREALRVGLPYPELVQICGPAPAEWASPGDGLKFVCGLLDDAEALPVSDLARLAFTGSAR